MTKTKFLDKPMGMISTIVGITLAILFIFGQIFRYNMIVVLFIWPAIFIYNNVLKYIVYWLGFDPIF